MLMFMVCTYCKKSSMSYRVPTWPALNLVLCQLKVFLLPPGWDASPSQGYPQQYMYVAGTHFIRPCRHEERQRVVKFLV